MLNKAVAIAVLASGCGVAGAAIIGPSPYLSVADSPFTGLGLTNFSLDDFEDGLANTPDVSYAGSGTLLFPSAVTDSVDGDDGAIDGFGNDGFSLAASQVILQRLPVQNGTFPTHVGFVVTDIGGVVGGGPIQGVSQVSFRILFPGGGETTYGPFTLGDGQVLGQTAEDRFFGFVFPQGISRVQIQQVGGGQIEIDHVQYGGAIPGPGVMGVLAAGGILATPRRRR